MEIEVRVGEKERPRETSASDHPSYSCPSVPIPSPALLCQEVFSDFHPPDSQEAFLPRLSPGSHSPSLGMSLSGSAFVV